jgi:hypothetical protein
VLTELGFTKLCAVKGIPDRSHFEPIPKANNSLWTLNIQHHLARRAGPHFDIRLGDGSSHAFSWASRRLPASGEKVLAVEQPTHTAEYMGFSGEIAEGYGAGTVKSQILEKVEVLDAKPDKITFNRYKGGSVERYALIRTNGKEWVFYNYTTTEANRTIPDSKPKYKEVSFVNVDTEDSNQVIAPKIDGAHNTFILRPGKRVDVYSYRKSRKSDNRIDHSYRTDLYKVTSPKELGNTVVRGELFIPKTESHVTGGVLNANVFKSREKQKTVGKLDNVIFDVVKYKGKDVEDRPYSDKLEMLKKIHALVPALKLPELATTSKAKKKLYKQIADNNHPQTSEGVVVYNLDKSVPTKAKKIKDYDIEVTGTFPASTGSKYDGNAVGGFLGKFEGKGPEIRVGGGLSDELRQEMYNDPKKFVGRYARVKALSKLPSGKLRMPSFLDWRYEKYK